MTRTTLLRDGLGNLLRCALLIAAVTACATVGVAAQASRTATANSTGDTAAMIPAGFGSLRQDDIAIRVTAQGLSVRAIPLDENFIRTLSPDSYRTLHDLGESKRAAIEAILLRTGLPSASIWYVSFFNVEQGEARFTPQEVVLTNQGRDYRPVDILPLTAGFGNQRLRQREQAHAIFIFDGAVNPNQTIAMTISGQMGGDWRSVVQRVERERSLIRSRANAGRVPPPDRP